MKKILALGLVALVLVLAFSIIATPALAAGKGNGKANGKGNDHGNSSGATLMVSPNPVAAGAEFTVSGSGFVPSKPVVVALAGYSYFTTADSSGGLAFTWSFAYPGTYTMNAYQQRNSKWVLKAGTALTVTP